MGGGGGCVIVHGEKFVQVEQWVPMKTFVLVGRAREVLGRGTISLGAKLGKNGLLYGMQCVSRERKSTAAPHYGIVIILVFCGLIMGTLKRVFCFFPPPCYNNNT